MRLPNVESLKRCFVDVTGTRTVGFKYTAATPFAITVRSFVRQLQMLQSSFRLYLFRFLMVLAVSMHTQIFDTQYRVVKQLVIFPVKLMDFADGI